MELRRYRSNYLTKGKLSCYLSTCLLALSLELFPLLALSSDGSFEVPLTILIRQLLRDTSLHGVYPDAVGASLR